MFRSVRAGLAAVSVLTGLASGMSLGVKASEGLPADGSVSTLAVDPRTPRQTDLEELSRTLPYVSIFRVEAKSDLCKSEECGPWAEFFFLNPSPSPQDVTIGCVALDRDGLEIAHNTTELPLPGQYANVSMIMFAGADFDRFASVRCGVLKANSHKD